MSEWVAAQPAEASAAAWAAVDELAHAYVADGEHRSLGPGPGRRDIDLILGQATITTTLELNLPLSALTATAPTRPGDGPTRGDADRDPPVGGGQGGGRLLLRRPPSPASPSRSVQLPRVGIEAARVGLIPTEALTALLTDPDTRYRAVLHDPDTGALLAVDARVYRPNEATARSSAAATAPAASLAAPPPPPAPTSTTSPPSPPAETPTHPT